MKRLLILLFTICICACKSSQSEPKKELQSITIEEYQCEGTCPSYDMTFNSNGTAEYYGRVFVKKEGRAIYNFSLNDIDPLFELIDSINFLSLDDRYDIAIPDFQEIVISFRSKRIVIKDLEKLPEDFKQLVERLRELARSTGYIK